MIVDSMRREVRSSTCLAIDLGDGLQIRDVGLPIVAVG